MYEFFRYFSYTTIIVLLFGCAIGFFCFPRGRSVNRWLILYLVAGLTSELVFRYFGSISAQRYNLFVVPFFAITELIIFSAIYYLHLLKRSPKVFLLGLFGAMLIIMDILFLSQLFVIEQYQTYSKVISDFLIIVYCLLYYRQLLKTNEPNAFYLKLNAGVLSYFVINLLIFSSLNFLVNESINLVIVFWVLNVVASSAFYLFLTYQIWQHGKIRKPLQYG
ncbi:hypothetical protein BKI52_19265 [marine bacterium AO1-C]|nr:hypothetical protein BKI52_19265 [marine bacterium AO1-C]